MEIEFFRDLHYLPRVCKDGIISLTVSSMVPMTLQIGFPDMEICLIVVDDCNFFSSSNVFMPEASQEILKFKAYKKNMHTFL